MVTLPEQLILCNESYLYADCDQLSKTTIKVNKYNDNNIDNNKTKKSDKEFSEIFRNYISSHLF